MSGNRPPVVVLSELPPFERERFMDFLVSNNVEFLPDKANQNYQSLIRIKQGSKVDAPGATTTSVVGAKHFVKKGPSGPARHMTMAPKSHGPSSPKDAPVRTAAKIETLQSQQAVLRKRYPRFCVELPTFTSLPKEMTMAELSRFAEDVFQFRYAQDMESLRREAMVQEAERRGERAPPGVRRAPLPNFPSTVLFYIMSRKGLDRIIDQTCWSVAYSVELLRKHYFAAELFARFLEESYDLMDLLFYLQARDVTQRLGRLESNGAWTAIGHGYPNKVLSHDHGAWVPAPCRITPNMVGPRLAIQIVRECISHTSLQDKVLKDRLDSAMRDAPQQALAVDFFLKVLTEEYHSFRGHNIGLANDTENAMLEGKILDFLAFVQCTTSLEKFFQEMDDDCSGVVHRAQFIRVVEEKGYKGDPYEIWQVLDPDGDGYAGRAEFSHLDGSWGRGSQDDAPASKPTGPQIEIAVALQGLHTLTITSMGDEYKNVLKPAFLEILAPSAIPDLVDLEFSATEDGALNCQFQIPCGEEDPQEMASKLQDAQMLKQDLDFRLGSLLDSSPTLNEVLTDRTTSILVESISSPKVQENGEANNNSNISDTTSERSTMRTTFIGGLSYANLDPELQQEVDEITMRLSQLLEERGEMGIRHKDIRGWAMQVAIKRRRQRTGGAINAGPGPGAKGQPNTRTGAAPPSAPPQGSKDCYSISLTDMQKTWNTVYREEEEASKEDIMQGTHRALENSTKDLARLSCREAEAIHASNGGPPLSGNTRRALQDQLLEELFPTTNRLLEALVKDSWPLWQSILQADSPEDLEKAAVLKIRFEKLRDDLQYTITSGMASTETLGRVFSQLVATEALRNLGRDSAIRLLRSRAGALAPAAVVGRKSGLGGAALGGRGSRPSTAAGGLPSGFSLGASAADLADEEAEAGEAKTEQQQHQQQQQQQQQQHQQHQQQQQQQQQPTDAVGDGPALASSAAAAAAAAAGAGAATAATAAGEGAEGTEGGAKSPRSPKSPKSPHSATKSPRGGAIDELEVTAKLPSLGAESDGAEKASEKVGSPRGEAEQALDATLGAPVDPPNEEGGPTAEETTLREAGLDFGVTLGPDELGVEAAGLPADPLNEAEGVEADADLDLGLGVDPLNEVVGEGDLAAAAAAQTSEAPAAGASTEAAPAEAGFDAALAEADIDVGDELGFDQTFDPNAAGADLGFDDLPADPLNEAEDAVGEIAAAQDPEVPAAEAPPAAADANPGEIEDQVETF